MPDSPSRAGTDALEACIDACQQCHNACLQAAMITCLELGEDHVEPEHFRLMLHCAEICQTAANFMLGGSPLHGHVCAACAEVCDACAQSCERIGDMEECAQACRNCATECRAVAD
ncbi:MAG: four-helix bundle copper-binding protein [Pseudomonadota bacterium]